MNRRAGKIIGDLYRGLLKLTFPCRHASFAGVCISSAKARERVGAHRSGGAGVWRKDRLLLSLAVFNYPSAGGKCYNKTAAFRMASIGLRHRPFLLNTAAKAKAAVGSAAIDLFVSQGAIIGSNAHGHGRAGKRSRRKKWQCLREFAATPPQIGTGQAASLHIAELARIAGVEASPRPAQPPAMPQCGKGEASRAKERCRRDGRLRLRPSAIRTPISPGLFCVTE